tara:strand:+ start:184 stop:375 length:192 start_codon:yes stop_codon:yes gene_type:complete
MWLSLAVAGKRSTNTSVLSWSDRAAFLAQIEFARETKTIIANDAASALLDPASRKGWEEFYSI